jgi:hypothetical protein
MSDDDKKAAEGTADGTGTLNPTGVSQSGNWNAYIAGQTFRALWPNQPGKEPPDWARGAITAGIAGIAPKDSLEDMIAAQMLACHNVSMYCYAIALNSNTTGLRHEHMNQAGKLSRAFAMLLDALNRHRGKGQQKITVEHVHVHSGGQAVVGIVEAPGGGVLAKSEDQAHARERLSCWSSEDWLPWASISEDCVEDSD